MHPEFWSGVLYACEYFRDELGIEDAMETDIAKDAWNDAALYDEGYYNGILKAVEIIESVRNTENVERVPFHLTMSAVASTLRELAKG